MISEALLFRLFGIIVGIGLGLFSYSLMKATKGATKGWLFFSIAGIAFFLWTSLMSIFTITDLYVGRVVTSLLFMPGTIILVMSFARLVEDFGIKRPNWLTAKNFLVINVAFIVILAIVLSFFNDDILQVLLISVIVDSILANLMGVIAAVYLWKGTGKGIWISMVIFLMLFAIGQFFCVYAGNCCKGELEGEEVCESYDLDYTNVFGLPCSATFTQISLIGYNLMTVGGLLLLANFYYLWIKLAKKEK